MVIDYLSLTMKQKGDVAKGNESEAQLGIVESE